MELTIHRSLKVGDAWLGICLIDGARHAVSLERVSQAIPVGRYQVLMTVSGRATRGELWSPDPSHLLPLINGVPGRDGIRIHAANFSDELEGCIALGQSYTADRIVNSRMMLIPLMDDIMKARARGEEVWIDVQNSPA